MPEKKVNYRHTLAACYIGYIVQAIVNNLPALLFTAFSRDLGLNTVMLSSLITINFTVQLLTDAVSVKLLDKIGYRTAVVISHLLCTVGLILMGILPFAVSSPFAGLAVAMTVNAIGGGLIEVIISPIVEAIPGDEKASAMSLLHSFYCWGHMAVVIITTVMLLLAGADNWRYIPIIWAIVPFVNMLLFMTVPLNTLCEEGCSMPLRELLKSKALWLFLMLMVCAGAAEQAMSQWTSYFAETGLGVSKTMGDLLGPCGFALFMGTARAFFATKGKKISTHRAITASCVLCIAAYLGAVFSPLPILSLISCAVCGFSVGVLWPGTYSTAAKACPLGGNAMFALLALAGDLGCSLGPSTVGIVSDISGSFNMGLLCGIIFPIVMLIGMIKPAYHRE
ncbi:MAG: MFS transporter [Oscillospiraceae bacterium]|nr:MFS transporter [Oscillospiraceae bacterium]